MLIIWLALVAAPAVAAPGDDGDDIEHLARLINAGEMERAWHWAQAHRAGMEGLARFDLYYGIAAVESGHFDEGVFALRRALARYPELDRARLYLARAYFALDHDDAARREFERVLARDPPAPLPAGIERYLDAIDRRAQAPGLALSGYVEIGGGHDTNVNSATTVDSVDSLDGPLVVDERGQEQADDFARIAGGLRLAHTPAVGLGAFATLTGERRYHDDHPEYALAGAEVHAGLSMSAEDTRSTLAVHGQWLELDSKGFRDLAGIDAGVRHALSEQRVIKLSGRYSRQHYDEAEHRDADLAQLAVGSTRLWLTAWRPVTSISLLYGEERALGDTAQARASAERDVRGITFALRLHPGAVWTVGGDLAYRDRRYAETAPLFGERREDAYASATLYLEWRFARTWQVRAQVLRAVNDSNLALHDYDRSVAGLRLRYVFGP